MHEVHSQSTPTSKSSEDMKFKLIADDEDDSSETSNYHLHTHHNFQDQLIYITEDGKRVSKRLSAARVELKERSISVQKSLILKD